VNVVVNQNERRNAPLADVEIAVPLGNRGPMDFSDTQSIIDLGYKTAAQNQTALEQFSLLPEEWDEYIRTRKSRQRMEPTSGPLLEVSSSQPIIQRSAAEELFRKAGATTSRGR